MGFVPEGTAVAAMDEALDGVRIILDIAKAGKGWSGEDSWRKPVFSMEKHGNSHGKMVKTWEKTWNIW